MVARRFLLTPVLLILLVLAKPLFGLASVFHRRRSPLPGVAGIERILADLHYRPRNELASRAYWRY